MTTPRLPETDLARIAPMPPAQQRKELERMKDGGIPYTYNPFHGNCSDILHVGAGAFDLPRPPWSKIEGQINHAGRYEKERVANLQVGEGLYIFATTHKVRGRKQEFLPVKVGLSEKVIYWIDYIVEIDGKPVVLFVDPRRADGLTINARRFVFSVMDYRIRVPGSDYEKVRLGIVQFGDERIGPRTARIFYADGVELYSYEALDAMVRQTYEIRREVYEGIRRSGDEDDLPLFGKK